MKISPALRRALAVDQIRLARVRMRAVHLHRVGPTGRDSLRHREPVLGVPNRRRQQLRERLGAESLPHRVPSRGHAGHGHRVDAALRHLLDALRCEEVDGQAGRRPAARVEAVDGAGLRLVVNDEEVAAEAVAGRLHQADGRVGGDRGVDGVAAALEDLHAGARRQRLARRDDPERRRHHRSADDRRADAHRSCCCAVVRSTEAAPATVSARTFMRKRDGHVSNVHGPPPVGGYLKSASEI